MWFRQVRADQIINYVPPNHSELCANRCYAKNDDTALIAEGMNMSGLLGD